jgi:hypothetical protein
MALLTVVLVAALVLISIVSIAARAATEGTIVTGQSLSKKALSVAEAGLADVLADLRNAEWTASTVPHPRLGNWNYLMGEQIASLAQSWPGIVVVTGENRQLYPNPSSDFAEYRVKIVKDEGEQWNGTDAWKKTVRLKIYSSAWVYSQASSSHSAAAATSQRIVYAVYDVGFNLKATWTSTTVGGLFNYGILSGGQMNVGGNGMVNGGNIRSLTGIDVGSKERVGSGYVAYSPQIPTGNHNALKNVDLWWDYPPSDNLTLPTTLDLVAYRAKALAFKTGQPPYDGNSPGYPNTSSVLVQTAIQTYLGSGPSSTPDDVASFYDDLANDHTWQLASPDLMNNLTKAVYYIEGDGNFSTSNSTIQGTVVMNGNLVIHGGTLSAGAGGLALLVQGNIDVGNGNPTVTGNIFATGNLTQFNGNFTVNGSVAVAGTVEKGNGTFTVNYQPSPDIDPVIVRTPGTGVDGSIDSVGYPTSGDSTIKTPWREASSANFDDPIGHPK